MNEISPPHPLLCAVPLKDEGHMLGYSRCLWEGGIPVHIYREWGPCPLMGICFFENIS